MAAPPAAAPAERRIPRVREAPLLGSLRAAQRDRLGFFLRVARECGDIGQFRLGPARGVFVNAPELIHALLVERARDFDKGAFQRRHVRSVAGDGVFTAERAAHQRQRRLLAPAFTPRRVAGYADTMVASAERAQAAWPDGATLDLAGAMTALTMCIVGRALLDAELSETEELGAAVTAGFRWVEYAFTRPLPLPLAVPTARNRCTRRALAVLRQRLGAIIAERRASGEDRGDLLSLLLARDEEVVGMFGAGHETTANALTWCAGWLARPREFYRDSRHSAVCVV